LFRFSLGFDVGVLRDVVHSAASSVTEKFVELAQGLPVGSRNSAECGKKQKKLMPVKAVGSSIDFDVFSSKSEHACYRPQTMW